MKYKIILCTALLLAAGFSAPAHGPYDCWGYSEKKPGLYCVIPGPHGERPGMDRYSRSVVLVSVDPERDTPNRLGEYAHAFHKDTIAATADVPSLERFATSLGMVFQKAPGKHFEQNPDDYSMDHSASIAVLDPQGRVAGLMRPPFNPQAIASDLKKLTEKSAP